ncbi:MAG TPA: LptF/LptG family permease [Saprospiraceae bacterium]|nr:LptF/LptG family permease [Saprospiraceae bacterium]
MIKKIDQLLIRSFIAPFLTSYSVALFVLVMQVLWLYIDDIAGKGLSPWLIMELLIYRSMALVPIALTLGMLIASVMTMGNLAERYELSSFKSAGISLWRIMRPIIVFGSVVCLFSMYTSNTLIPISNLKFGSRMFDIQQKKPTLQMEAGTFNYDFQGFAIHFKDKSSDGRTIKEVLIYDHTSNLSGELSHIVAESGEMFTAMDGRLFIMSLNNGYQYLDRRPRSGRQRGKYPFVRTSFDKYEVVFDLGEFELARTNPELFNRNRQMMTTTQLTEAIDSIAKRIDMRTKEFSNYTSGFLHFEQLDSTYMEPQEEEMLEDIPTSADAEMVVKDMSQVMGDSLKKAKVKADLNAEKTGKALVKNKVSIGERKIGGGTPKEQILDSPPEAWGNLMSSFAKDEQRNLISKVRTGLRSILNQAESAERSIDRMRISRIKHIYDMHMKYSMAVVCIIFVFIGAPMGAIIRKGGFGYPILVSIIFFIIFVVLMIFCRKFAEAYFISATLAAWLPCIILMPVGLFLTYKAMQDSKLMDISLIFSRIGRFFRSLSRKKESHA